MGINTPLSTKIGRSDLVADILLIVLITAFVFGLYFHPHFFGDELIGYELAARNNSFFSIFHELNANKPRLVFNGIEALLAKLHASRLTHAMLVASCMMWINVLIFSVARYQFNASRLLAWLLVLGVLSSRYGAMLYFDYLSGLIEMLSSALLLSTMLLAWMAWRGKFNFWYAAGAFITALTMGLVHERYLVGSLAIGSVIVIAEWFGAYAKRRLSVLSWALSLSFVPIFIYWSAVQAIGSLPISTVGGHQRVSLGLDTLWTALTYSYNVVLGGNYGHNWFWGEYNYLHPEGKFLGWLTVSSTVLMTVIIYIRKGFAWNNRWMGLGLGAAAVAFIAVASLAGTARQEARFMFPVGILILIIWFVILKNTWRYVAITLILATNVMYISLDSHDSMAYIYSSRNANSLASSLLAVQHKGKNGIVVGNRDDFWTIGGGQWKLAYRNGEVFSKMNLGSTINVDPMITGQSIDPSKYDFGLAFSGFGPHRVANYRWITVDTAMQMVGALDLDNKPVKRSLGSNVNWTSWQWRSQPDLTDGALRLTLGVEGWLAVPAQELNEHWLVFRARSLDKLKTPMRLQVNWHAKQDNRFLSTSIRVVYPNEIWSSYSALLHAPPNAEIGYVYATLHGEVKGTVEVQSIEIK